MFEIFLPRRANVCQFFLKNGFVAIRSVILVSKQGEMLPIFFERFFGAI